MKINRFEELNEKVKEPKDVKGKKLKKLLEDLGYDVMYHEEHKEYFFEAKIDGKIKTIWLNDYLT